MQKPKVQVDKLKRNIIIITVAKCGVLIIYIHTYVRLFKHFNLKKK